MEENNLPASNIFQMKFKSDYDTVTPARQKQLSPNPSLIISENSENNQIVDKMDLLGIFELILLTLQMRLFLNIAELYNR